MPTMPGWGARQMVNAPGFGQTPQKLPPGSGFWGGQMQGAKPGLTGGFGLPQPQGGLYGLNNKPAMSTGFGQMPQQPGGLQGSPAQQATQPFTPQPFDAPTGQRPQGDPYAGMSGSDIFARLFQR